MQPHIRMSLLIPNSQTLPWETLAMVYGRLQFCFLKAGLWFEVGFLLFFFFFPKALLYEAGVLPAVKDVLDASMWFCQWSFLFVKWNNANLTFFFGGGANWLFLIESHIWINVKVCKTKFFVFFFLLGKIKWMWFCFSLSQCHLLLSLSLFLGNLNICWLSFSSFLEQKIRWAASSLFLHLGACQL